MELEHGNDVVRCNDSAYSRNLTKILKRADADTKKYPFVGYTNTLGMCNYWKFTPLTRTIDLAGVPRMLMFDSEGDPATAYEGALAAHKKTAAHTRLVSVDNEGQHGAVHRRTVALPGEDRRQVPVRRHHAGQGHDLPHDPAARMTPASTRSRAR